MHCDTFRTWHGLPIQQLTQIVHAGPVLKTEIGPDCNQFVTGYKQDCSYSLSKPEIEKPKKTGYKRTGSW